VAQQAHIVLPSVSGQRTGEVATMLFWHVNMWHDSPYIATATTMLQMACVCQDRSPPCTALSWRS
jgi:hypothetical protein